MLLTPFRTGPCTVNMTVQEWLTIDYDNRWSRCGENKICRQFKIKDKSETGAGENRMTYLNTKNLTLSAILDADARLC